MEQIDECRVVDKINLPKVVDVVASADDYVGSSMVGVGPIEWVLRDRISLIEQRNLDGVDGEMAFKKHDLCKLVSSFTYVAKCDVDGYVLEYVQDSQLKHGALSNSQKLLVYLPNAHDSNQLDLKLLLHKQKFMTSGYVFNVSVPYNSQTMEVNNDLVQKLFECKILNSGISSIDFVADRFSLQKFVESARKDLL